MAYEEISALLGGWEGFEVIAVRRVDGTPTQPIPQIVLELQSIPEYPKRCSRCGAVVVEVHDVTERRAAFRITQ